MMIDPRYQQQEDRAKYFRVSDPPNLDFKLTIFSNDKYLDNSTKQRYIIITPAD